MYWKETGDLSVWKGIAQDALIMNLDDLLCVGVTDNILLSSTIGRNKNLIPGEVLAAIINGTQELLDELAKWGVQITSTGGETADVGDLVRTIIVDSTVTARVKRSEILDNARIQAGRVVKEGGSEGGRKGARLWIMPGFKQVRSDGGSEGGSGRAREIDQILSFLFHKEDCSRHCPSRLPLPFRSR